LKNIKDRVLGNGFKVIYAKDDSNPLLSLHLFVKMGSAWEKAEEAGYSHFSEHLVFKGTRSYPQGMIMDRISFLGGSINAYTEYDSTCYYITIPKEYYAEALKMLVELVRCPQFTEEEFKSEKQVILEELSEVENDPEEFLIEKVARTYLDENPYGNPIIGNRESITKAHYQDLQGFISRYYIPGMCFLVCTGDFDEADLNSVLDSLLSDWQASEIFDRKPFKDGYPQKFAYHKLSHRNESDIIAIALPDLAETDDEAYCLSMVYKALFMGRRSAMHKGLFSKRQMIDTMRLHSLTGVSDGLSILTILPKEGIEPIQIITAFREILEDFMLRGISATELLMHQAELLNTYKYSFEYMESLASSLGSEEVYGDYNGFLEYPEKVKKISRLWIHKIMEKWIDIDKFQVFYLGNSKLAARDVKEVFKKKKVIARLNGNKTMIERTLAGGQRVLLHQIKGKPAVGIAASFAVGQLNERPGHRGINQLTSSLLLYGNSQYNYEQLTDFCGLHGINLRSSHRPELTKISGKCFLEDLPLALELFSNVIFEPTFPRDHFENLRQTTISVLRRYKDYPSQYAYILWRKMMYGAQSMITAREGRRGDLNQLTLTQIKNWHKRYFTTDNMTLVLTGDMNFDSTLSMVEKYFAKKTIKGDVTEPDYTINPTRKRYQMKDMKSSQAVIILGGFGPGYQEQKKMMAIYILSIVLGGDTNSRLFDELREKRGLAYSVDMSYFAFKDFGVFGVNGVVDRENVDVAIELIKEELYKVAQNGITEYELEKARNYLLGQMLQEQEGVAVVAGNLSTQLALGWDYEHYLMRKARLFAITQKQIGEIAEEVLKEENYFIQVLK